MGRTNQGGSILSFLVVGGVMALLLIGGVYAVRHVFAPDRNPEVASREEKDTSSNAPSGRPVEETPPPKTEESESKQDKNDGADAPQQSETTQPTDAPAQQHDGVSDSLPATGPTDVVLESLLISSLVAVMVMYVRSREYTASL